MKRGSREIIRGEMIRLRENLNDYHNLLSGYNDTGSIKTYRSAKEKNLEKSFGNYYEELWYLVGYYFDHEDKNESKSS